MKKVISFGEALIDFVPTVSGLPLSGVTLFQRAPGGAPANVAVAVARLGGLSYFAGKVGADAFGEYLRTMFGEYGVHTDYLLSTAVAKTALAFVSLRADGERDFLFYRDPSADLLLAAHELTPDWFSECAVFHYGSLSLTGPVSAAATLAAIRLARAQGALLSFDPNLRLALWPSPIIARTQIVPLLASADVLKLGADELAFLLESDDERRAADSLLEQGVALLVVTCGAAGCRYYTPYLSGSVPVRPVQAVDTTGAGDAFVGGLLYQLAERGLNRERLASVLGERATLETMLAFANACGALTTSGRGAIPALPTQEQVTAFLRLV